ncbi:hypothetical protein [Cytobacillus oceanisediminis]|uniref:Uncharacterized protein n=1 Tax=Cytobacillus oceanisediminis 2691 TaxID=1196031 RepID=A0A160MEA1_9BACI|nr:hypothetical protein [Cytobacillus oceanisediminis]AND41442.1 hypothetical protein A361_20505 [Cytobacillus oceanisediminis 2691]
MEETLRQILWEIQKVNNRLENLEKGQEILLTGQKQLNDNLINGLVPYFEQIEKHYYAKTSEFIDTLERPIKIQNALVSHD